MVSFPRFEPWGQIVVGQVSLDELLAHKGWLLTTQIDAFLLSIRGMCPSLVSCPHLEAGAHLQADELTDHTQVVIPSAFSWCVKDPHSFRAPTFRVLLLLLLLGSNESSGPGRYMDTDAKKLAGSRRFDMLHAGEVLGATDIFHIKNINNTHWVLLHVIPAHRILRVIDGLALATEADAAPFLTFLSALTSRAVDYDTFTIQICNPETKIGIRLGFPTQADGSACGVFACVTLLHLLMDAKIHYTHTSIPHWRMFMAQKIVAASEQLLAMPQPMID